ncbi:hypothetical protein B566_EDAN009696 [Ephemera danica]|nr:hypothetical protein B566_EDAN009696 [Ephemera danica]
MDILVYHIFLNLILCCIMLAILRFLRRVFNFAWGGADAGGVAVEPAALQHAAEEHAGPPTQQHADELPASQVENNKPVAAVAPTPQNEEKTFLDKPERAQSSTDLCVKRLCHKFNAKSVIEREEWRQPVEEEAAVAELQQAVESRRDTMTAGEHHRGGGGRVSAGSQFRLGPSLLGRDVRVFCNHPESGEPQGFERRRYRELQWHRDGGPADDTAIFTDVAMVRAGSFHFYFSCDANLADQLQLNPIFSDGGRHVRIDDVEKLVSKMSTEWKALRGLLVGHCLPKARLWELYTVDVEATLAQFTRLARERGPMQRTSSEELHIVQDPQFRRRQSTVNMELALTLYNIARSECSDETQRVQRCTEALRQKLEALNREVTDTVQSHLMAAVDNCCAGVRYFTWPGADDATLEEAEQMAYGPGGRFIMAHNGWVMDYDPLKNFAEADSNVYLRRELIAWGDSVKLRYGDKPEDCPYLWQHMRDYVEQTARTFHGIRLDNCHSTPIPVAEFLLDAARQIRPDLYVVAELFTNSDAKDNIFINCLGITSLIREAMSAWDSHEEGRLVYRYGGDPVGAFLQPSLRPLVPSIAHALFLDVTHDNPSPVKTRSVYDLMPSTSLVAMACCASGSSRGYDELVPHHVFVDQVDGDVVAVTRHCPITHQSVVLVACTAFHQPEPFYKRSYTKPLRLEGTIDEIILEATLTHKESKSGGAWFVPPPANFKQDSRYINGLVDYRVKLRERFPLSQAESVRQGDSGDPLVTQIDFTSAFQPGCVVAFRISLNASVTPGVTRLRRLADRFLTQQRMDTEPDLDRALAHMSLADLNRALFRCEQEERDEGHGFGAYDIPSFGPTVYCGLQGFMSLLSEIRPKNDLGHPMCGNLRGGNWMMGLGRWFEDNMQPLKEIPRYLVPSYFDAIVTGVYSALLSRVWDLMFVQHGSTFLRGLALGSVQCGGVVGSAQLPRLSPSLAPPLPPTRPGKHGIQESNFLTLSAGLPHFSTGYMRNWGRDTFISLRGLFILTGRYQEASYVREAPDGHRILHDPVSRIFPKDDSQPQEPGTVDQPLHEVIYEAMRTHFQGLKFRERNAGTKIDAHMTDQGFNNEIGIDLDTGFVFGGNEHNCGTWMDKMGSSERAGTRGRPATPRDGSAVELVGLCKAALKFLASVQAQGHFPHSSVTRRNSDGSSTTWTWHEWEARIAANFERHFWVSSTPAPEREPRPELIHRRGVYKDSHGATQPWADFQLRPNFTIAMVATETVLLGPLGMKTLDPADWAYCGDYDNSNDGTDSKVAQGFNYHQGPEWVWPVGFFLRARLQFAREVGGDAELRRTIAATKAYLSRHYTELCTSPWRGLPELTNKDGAYCRDSCRTQAWSMATILEVITLLR